MSLIICGRYIMYRLYSNFFFKTHFEAKEKHIYEVGMCCVYFRLTFFYECDMDQKDGCFNVTKWLQIICGKYMMYIYII
jgi:hypothetical protein